jgi:ribonucleotide monophosphatase NagD (HAD superfamily)
LFPYSESAIHLLRENGYKVLAFTNQPDISNGKVIIKIPRKNFTPLGLAMGKWGYILTSGALVRLII